MPSMNPATDRRPRTPEGTLDYDRVARNIARFKVIKRHRETWYRFTGTHYRALSEEAVRTLVGDELKLQIDHAGLKDKSDKALKVSRALVSNVVDRLIARALVSDD